MKIKVWSLSSSEKVGLQFHKIIKYYELGEPWCIDEKN